MAPFESKNQAMATKISDNGFFSDEAIRKGELIKQEHKQLFFYLAEVNEQAHRYLGLWRVSSTYVKQLFSAGCAQSGAGSWSTSASSIVLLVH